MAWCLGTWMTTFIFIYYMSSCKVWYSTFNFGAFCYVTCSTVL